MEISTNERRMDSIMTFCKENYGLITLLVGVVGVLVSVVSLICEIKKRKSNRSDDGRREA